MTLMRKLIGAALVLLIPAAMVMAGHSSGGSHGGSSHSGGSHSGGSSHSGGGSRSGGSHISGFHGGGGSHGGSGHGWHGGGRHRGGGWIVFEGPFWGGWGWWGWGCPDCYGPPYVVDGGDDASYQQESQRDDWGTIDSEIWPENARVYLNGRYIGAAEDFDGREDYLYLRPGDYTLGFRLKGYEPASTDINVESGAKIDVNRKLHKIPGSTEVVPANPPLPEGGVRHYWGKKGGKLVAYSGKGDNARNGRDTGDSDDDADQDQAPPGPHSSMDSGPAHHSTPTARIQLSMEPRDAVVYLDDHLIGTVAHISRAEGGMSVAPGAHTITVMRPGFKPQTVRVEVSSGESKKVELSLEK
jgi:PEGA domain